MEFVANAGMVPHSMLSLFYGILRESFEWFITVPFEHTISSLEKINKCFMKELISHFRSKVDSHTRARARARKKTVFTRFSSLLQKATIYA